MERDKSGHPIMIKGKTHDKLIGITFLRKQTDGSKERAQVVQWLEDRRNPNSNHSTFELAFDSQECKTDIMTYNDIMNHLHRDQLKDNGSIWKYRNILGHQGPLTHRDQGYKGSKYNVKIE